MAHCPRCLSIPGGHNIRDFGGIPLIDGSVTRSGVLVRGEAPSLLGDEGVEALLEYGVRHVIDLRGEEEVAREGLGPLLPYVEDGTVQYRNADMTVRMDEAIQGDAIYDDLARTYLACLNTGGNDLASALNEALYAAAQENSAVYFHCAVGKDRTGTVAATILDMLDAEPEWIIQDYLMTGVLFRPIINRLRLSPSYQKSLAEVSDEALMPRRSVIEGFLNLLHGEGGGKGWLVDHGVTFADQGVWRHVLTD